MKSGDTPAMPYIEYHDGEAMVSCEGLTKREHFAIEAMQGILASERPNYSSDPEGNAKAAIANADALLKALEDEK